jgi:Putative restriction endonuclease
MEALRFDPELDDLPRAPSQEEWDRLTPEEQQRVMEDLPSEFEWAAASEGDPHRKAKERAFQTLDEHFRRIRRRVYLSAELPIYYPNEPVFAPDVIAVVDVELHERNRWVVSHERRGLDFVLEINFHGRRKKDFHDNPERFLRLRIPEYFAYDIEDEFLLGWRLDGDRYETIMPTGADRRVPSRVLGLELAIVDGRLCFFHGEAQLPDSRELIQRLSTMVDDAVRRAEEEAHRAEEEAHRAEEEAHRANRLAARLRELGVDPDEDDRAP